MMDVIHVAVAGIMSPVTLAFALGVLATLLRSDLRIPPQVYTALSIYLLLAIGLKGGHQLAGVQFAEVAWPLLATVVLGVITPLVAFGLARAFRFDGLNSGALAAHYGSVSAVTFATALAYMDSRGVSAEGFMPAVVAVLEVPAVVIGIVLARVSAARGAKVGIDGASEVDAASGRTMWGSLMHEVLTGKSIVLLAGGLLIGRFCTEESFTRVAPVFVNLFFGALVLFMLDMGTVAGEQMRAIKKAGVRLVTFAIVMPILGGLLGMFLGTWAGLSVGGTSVFAVLGASASYIAAPAAIRLALPEANPGLYLTAAIGITFPLNLTIGIPFFHALTAWYRAS